MSIRLRLTLWYTTVLALVVILFGLALHSLLTNALTNTIDRQLETVAQRVQEAAQMRFSFLGPDGGVDVPDLNVLATPGIYIQIYDDRLGQTIRSHTLGESSLPLDSDLLNSLLRGQVQRETVSVGGAELRIYGEALDVEGNVEGIVQVGTSLAQVSQTRRQLLGILAVGGMLAVLVSGVLGALVAGAALRPIDRITQTALTISRTEDLSQRLEVRGPADEVGRLAAVFNQMMARLEGLFRAQERLVADVSHELRTPLTTIQGNVDLLRRGAADDPEIRRESLADIESEVSRMSRLVADLLLLARVDAGAQLEKEPVELDTLLLEVYRQAQVMSSTVQVRLGHEDQASVLGDADRLRQLLLNLVDNAIKYTPAGGQVTLSLYRDGDWVQILVADTGIGIPAEDLQPGPHGVPLIFERFYRSDPTRSRARGGTGLGLSIAHWIAQAHGGEIQVASQVGTGSTFTLRLPVS